MTFSPVLPSGGYAGWRFLQRTLPAQTAAWAASPEPARLAAHFRERIAAVRTADDLLSDRMLLRVALGAFGLEADLPNTAFLRRVLTDGTLRPDAIANRLADKRYAAFSARFGFGDLGARTGEPGFAEEILTRFTRQGFGAAVGRSEGALRLALNLGPELEEMGRSVSGTNAQWFGVMANRPLREVFETALGLPRSFGRIDIDQQLSVFRARAAATFGTDRPSDFAEGPLQERLVRLFLLRSEAQAAPAVSGAAAALSLLQARPR